MEGKMDKMKKALPFLIGIVIGIAFGLGVVAGREAGESSSSLRIFHFLIVGASLFLGTLFHVIIHEAGHLVGGLLSGYRFVSFTIGSTMLIKENGKLKRKKFNIAGAGGQCLMSPPEMKDGAYPFFLYNLSGSLTNIVVGIVFIVLFALLRNSFSYAGEVFFPLAFVGLALGIFNILPINAAGLATDGHNIASLRKNEQARQAFWLMLTANGKFTLGERFKDFPAEWFEAIEDDCNDPISANLLCMKLSRLLDCHDFAGAKALAEEMLQNGKQLIEILKNEIRCELLFLEIIGEPSPERSEKIESLYTPELKQYIKASKTQLSKHRLIYAYEKLVAHDEEKAEKALATFHKTALTYPYAGDCESERELLGVVEGIVTTAYK
jgi:hypothetical protein